MKFKKALLALLLCYALVCPVMGYAGEIIVTQYQKTGTRSENGAPVADITSIKATTRDTTTSTSAETFTTNSNTRVITVFAVQAHRISSGTDTSASAYAYIPAGVPTDLSVTGSTPIYFRLDQ